MNLYSVRDRLAHEFAPPFSAINDAVAERTFRNMMSKIPSCSDFELHFVGSFDESKGVLVDVPQSREIPINWDPMKKNDEVI